MEDNNIIEETDVLESEQFDSFFWMFDWLWFADYFISTIVWIIVFIWIWAILWTTKDISNRTNNIFLQILSIILVAVFTPIFWLALYFLIRPVRYKYDNLPWREALANNIVVCDYCFWENDKDNNYCVACGNWLKITCKECKKSYPKSYDYCNNCWAPNIEES